LRPALRRRQPLPVCSARTAPKRAAQPESTADATSSGAPHRDATIELIQSWWKQIGVNLEVLHDAMRGATLASIPTPKDRLTG
jgi:hypothetical protein